MPSTLSRRTTNKLQQKLLNTVVPNITADKMSTNMANRRAILGDENAMPNTQDLIAAQKAKALAENKKRNAGKKRSKARKIEEAIMADQAFEASLAEGLAPTPVKAPRARCAKSLVSRPITFDYDNEASPKPLRRRCLLANVVGTALRFAAPAAAVAIIVAGHIRRRG